MSKTVGTALKALNIIVVSLYLLACLTPYLPSGKYWIVALLGLAFPLLFIMVITFFVGWLLIKSKWNILSLFALIISWQQLAVMVGLNTKKDFNYAKAPKTLRIFSWNVSSWGKSNKSQLPKTNYGTLTIELIKKQQADILCFQEYWDRKDWYSKECNILAFKDLGYKQAYFVKSLSKGEEQETGVVILSKYPITDTATFSYGENDYAEHLIYADIQVEQQKFRIFTTHLQSVRFNDGEYSAVTKIKQTNKEGLKSSKLIVSKLKYAYRFRTPEADIIRQKIMESPYPVILCGDFNDVPNSYTYFTVKGDLQDAFLKKGSGLGRTFQYLSPTLRIDYILADKRFKVLQYNCIKVPYSDHYPIVADLNYENY